MSPCIYQIGTDIPDPYYGGQDGVPSGLVFEKVCKRDAWKGIETEEGRENGRGSKGGRVEREWKERETERRMCGGTHTHTHIHTLTHTHTHTHTHTAGAGFVGRWMQGSAP
jgi:hypothetical protein